MDKMIGLGVGQKITGDMYDQLAEAGFGDRTFMTCGADGLTVYIVLTGMTPKEKKAFGETLTVRVHPLKPPIMTLEYPKMSFDVPVLCDRIDIEKNGMTIFAIESYPQTRKFIMRHIRMIGLNAEIMAALEKANEIGPSMRLIHLKDAYAKLDAGDIKKGPVQRFKRS